MDLAAPSGFFPNDQHRITIIGKTGSGKTQGGAFLLSNRSYHRQPWIIFDLKFDDLLNQIPGRREIGLHEKLPKHPGLYIVHPTPGQKEEMEAFMWAVHRRERIGMYVDEGYMIPERSEAFQAILTQGRSKHIPVILLTQRPSWLTRFAFSEADFIQLYQITDQRDAKTAKQFMPMPVEQPLPAPYYSWWYDSTRHRKHILKPVPSQETILTTFYNRTKAPRRVF